MTAQFHRTQAEICRKQQQLARAENVGLPEAIREAQERLPRAVRVQAALVRAQ
jgi:hypothetical protein